MSDHDCFVMMCHDRLERAEAMAKELCAEAAALRTALEFYADNANWQSRVIRTAFDSEGNITGQECETGPAWDAGARARQALGLLLNEGRADAQA
jgi:hypothetical protein